MSETNNTQNKITPEQALAVVTSLVRATKLSFEEHVYANQCVEILTQAIQTQTPSSVEKLNKPSNRNPVIVDN